MRRLRLGMMAGGLPPTPLLLDLYPGAVAAYSVRKLRLAYAGSAIRVRRASDNAEQNINFNNSGELDISGLTAFCTGTNGFVTTWYDQSGNANNLTQISATAQPKIYDSILGVVLVFSKAALSFDGTNDFLYSSLSSIINQPFYSSMVSTVSINAIVPAIYFDSTPPNRAVLAKWNTTQTEVFAGGQILGSTFSNGIRYLFSTLYNSTLSYLYRNNVLSVSGNAGSNKMGDIFFATRYTLSNYSQINSQELIFWNSDQSSNRNAININTQTYYGIP